MKDEMATVESQEQVFVDRCIKHFQFSNPLAPILGQ
jgi:hypothetical protein